MHACGSIILLHVILISSGALSPFKVVWDLTAMRAVMALLATAYMY